MAKTYKAAKRSAHHPTHPGVILREDVLPALRVTVKDAADALGVSRQALHNIVSERAGVSPRMALLLGKWLGNGPRFWLDVQQEHDLRRVEGVMAKAVAAIKPVEGH